MSSDTSWVMKRKLVRWLGLTRKFLVRLRSAIRLLSENSAMLSNDSSSADCTSFDKRMISSSFALQKLGNFHKFQEKKLVDTYSGDIEIINLWSGARSAVQSPSPSAWTITLMVLPRLFFLEYPPFIRVRRGCRPAAPPLDSQPVLLPLRSPRSGRTAEL